MPEKVFSVTVSVELSESISEITALFAPILVKVFFVIQTVHDAPREIHVSQSSNVLPDTYIHLLLSCLRHIPALLEKFTPSKRIPVAERVCAVKSTYPPKDSIKINDTCETLPLSTIVFQPAPPIRGLLLAVHSP